MLVGHLLCQCCVNHVRFIQLQGMHRAIFGIFVWKCNRGLVYFWTTVYFISLFRWIICLHSGNVVRMVMKVNGEWRYLTHVISNLLTDHHKIYVGDYIGYLSPCTISSRLDEVGMWRCSPSNSTVFELRMFSADLSNFFMFPSWNSNLRSTWLGHRNNKYALSSSLKGQKIILNIAGIHVCTLLTVD